MLMCIGRERPSVVQLLTILGVKTLGKFDKDYRGLNDMFISNFITIIVTVQKISTNLCSGNTFMSVFRMSDTCSSRAERMLAK